jgi:hypothetical protein
MCSVRPAMLVVLAVFWCTVAHGDEPVGEKKDTPFWLAPKIELNIAPVAVTLTSVPDDTVGFGMLQVGTVDPRTFVVSNPAAAPFVKADDAGYAVIPGGLKVGAAVYGDRTYAIRTLPPALQGLPLLRSRAAHKPIMDGRFAIVVSAAKPCYVMVAIDERAIEIYKQHGIPGWLQEYAPTGHKIETDDPLMTQAQAGYQIFARKAAAGRIALGPPCMDVSHNSMYFAFFAEAK